MRKERPTALRIAAYTGTLCTKMASRVDGEQDIDRSFGGVHGRDLELRVRVAPCEVTLVPDVGRKHGLAEGGAEVGYHGAFSPRGVRDVRNMQTIAFPVSRIEG